MGVNALNLEAINSLNFVKNRQGPISVIIESKEKASNWLKLPDHEIKSALKYLKAQTTIIFPVKNNIVENKILGPNNTLGIRFSKHPFCIALANYCSVPITTTSVNRTGEEPKTNVDEILNSFKNENSRLPLDLLAVSSNLKTSMLKRQFQERQTGESFGSDAPADCRIDTCS